jgi:hypothetical protein
MKRNAPPVQRKRIPNQRNEIQTRRNEIQAERNEIQKFSGPAIETFQRLSRQIPGNATPSEIHNAMTLTQR